MKTIRNETSKPLRIPLHAGHVLHLGPNKTGQVNDLDTERPSFRRLVDKGEVSVMGAAGEAEDAAPRRAGDSEPHSSTPHRKVVLTGGRTAGGRRER